MKRALPDADTVKAAIDMVLEEAATRGHRPTVTAIERRLGIPHATFHRHYAGLIDTHFRPRIPAAEHPHHHSPDLGPRPGREDLEAGGRAADCGRGPETCQADHEEGTSA